MMLLKGLSVLTISFLIFIGFSRSFAKTALAQNDNFVKVQITAVATGSITETYLNPPIGEVVLGGIPFFIPQANSIAISNVQNPTSFPINTDIVNVKKVHILINSYNTWYFFNSSKVGEVNLEFTDGSRHKVDLIIGNNIREWRQGDDITPTVNTVTDPNSKEVFRGLPTHLAPPAVIDMLTINLPVDLQNKTLSKIIISDTMLNSPGLFFVGITAELSGPPSQPFLDLPWDYQGKGLSFNDAALAINSYFDHEYPLLSGGLMENTSISNSVIFFRDGGRNTDLDYSSHDGYDYGRNAKVFIGDPVLAAAAGCASYRKNGAGGNMIFIDHDNGYQTRYLHLQDSGLITTSTSCVQVAKGQQIGKVGATGNVTPPGELGAHIHFMVVQDKNRDGNFDDNIPDGVTDPLGWQSTQTDPWPTFNFNYAGQQRTGNYSFYLYTKAIANLSATLTANGGFFELERYKLNFPQGATNQNLNLKMQSAPNVKTSNILESIGSTIAVTARNALGDLINTFQGFFTITIDFSAFDLTGYNTNTLSIYSSDDSVNWTKEPTNVNLVEKTASANLNHLTHFALMAERLDTVAPTTNAFLAGDQGQENWYRSNVQVTLNAQDNPGGSGIDYTLYKVNDGDWQQYHSPLTFTDAGSYTIDFYSADNGENIESIKNINFNIDKTPPEVKIFIDQDLEDLVIQGIDQNQTTVSRSENPLTNKKDDSIYIISDLDGNTLKLDVRDRDKVKEDRFKIYSVKYNNDLEVLEPDNHYNVNYLGKKNKLNVLEQNFEVNGEVKIRIKYDSKKDQSTIYTKEAGQEKIKQIRNGQVLLQLQTNKGNLEYSYR